MLDLNLFLSPPTIFKVSIPLRLPRPVCGLAMVDSNAMRKTFVVPDIKPLDLYDCTRAKICASVGWVLAKSYGNAGMWPRLLQPNVSNVLFCVFPTFPSLPCNPTLFPDCQCNEKRVHEGGLTARCVNSAILGTQRVAYSTFRGGTESVCGMQPYSAPHFNPNSGPFSDSQVLCLRICITSKIYPYNMLKTDALLFLFGSQQPI